MNPPCRRKRVVGDLKTSGECLIQKQDEDANGSLIQINYKIFEQRIIIS